MAMLRRRSWTLDAKSLGEINQARGTIELASIVQVTICPRYLLKINTVGHLVYFQVPLRVRGH
jgi:hypothetical protein